MRKLIGKIVRSTERRWILGKLAARRDTVEYQCAGVGFWVVGRSESSPHIEDLIDDGQVAKLCDWIRQETGSEKEIDQLAIVLVDRTVHRAGLSSRIRDMLQVGNGGGAWYGPLRFGVVPLMSLEITRSSIIHELTHGVIDALTDEFPFPVALEEGLAETVSALLPDETGVSDEVRRSSGGTSSSRRRLSDASYFCISDLLGSGGGQIRAQSCAKSYTAFVNASTWLFWFIHVNRKTRPKLWDMFRDIRVQNLRSGEAVYDWICDAGGWTAEQLEREFRQYCLTGEAQPAGGRES